MKRESIAALLERYWQAETTVEEERALAAYFRGHHDLPPEWEPYREIFSFFAEEADVHPGPDLEAQILEHVRPLAAITPAHNRIRLRIAWWAAAAVIILVAGLARSTQDVPVKDTYDDPQQALAAVQRALFKASSKINKGLHPLKKSDATIY